jgi:cytidine deaminase
MIDMQNTHVLESGISEGGVRETTIGELLPDSFGPEHLDMPRSMV